MKSERLAAVVESENQPTTTHQPRKTG